MNKYLLRGLIGIILGSVAIFYSFDLMHEEGNLYKWLMSLGVIVFGIGFLTVMYSLFRKIDKRSIQKHRRTQHRQKTQ